MGRIRHNHCRLDILLSNAKPLYIAFGLPSEPEHWSEILLSKGIVWILREKDCETSRVHCFACVFQRRWVNVAGRCSMPSYVTPSCICTKTNTQPRRVVYMTVWVTLYVYTTHWPHGPMTTPRNNMCSEWSLVIGLSTSSRQGKESCHLDQGWGLLKFCSSISPWGLFLP